jgi:hypothetical protein
MTGSCRSTGAASPCSSSSCFYPAGYRATSPYPIETGIGHLGNSSLRMVHRMTSGRTGAAVLRLRRCGVNLGLNARRLARWSTEIGGRAEALVVPVG